MARKGILRVRIVGDASDLRRSLSNTGSTLARWGKRAAMAVGAATAAAVAGSVKAFADFDQAMTQSLAIMGDVSDAMRTDMSQAARDVAKVTSFSAKEAAESYFFLASAGMDAEQSIAALPQVAAFAQAGLFDMARATDLATDAQSALALTSDDAQENLEQLTRVTDVFVKANTLANASVEEFAESITSKGGASMRELGVEIEEGTAILAVFADQGLKGSEAGTILARTLDGLAERARESSDGFEDLGVAVFDSEGEMRNVADIVGDLEGALEGMSTEQRNATLAQLGFNERARRGITMLLGNSEAMREFEKELREAGGTAQEVADKQLQNFWDQLGLLKDQFVDLGISIGERVTPFLTRFVETFQEAMPAVEQVLDDLMSAFGVFFGTAEESVEGVTDSWARNLPQQTGMVDSWARDIDTNTSEVTRFFQRVSNFINDDLTPAFETMKEWWDNNGDDLLEWGGEFKDGFTDAFKDVWNAVSTLIGWIDDLIDTFDGMNQEIDVSKARMFGYGAAVLLITKWLGGLKLVTFALKGAIAALGVAFSTAGLVIGTAMAAIVGWIAFFRRIWQTAVRVHERDWPKIVAGFEAVRDAVRSVIQWFEKLPSTIRKALVDTLRNMAGPLTAIADGLQRINPFARQSPSLVDQVKAGVEEIRRLYEGLDDLQVQRPALATAGVSPGLGARHVDDRPHEPQTVIHVHGSVIAERELYRLVRRQAAKDRQRNVRSVTL